MLQPISPPQKWRRPSLSARLRAGDAFIANVKAVVAQIRANRPGAAAGRDPEHLHQLRVGLRRLRSTLRACRALLRRKEAARLDRRLRDALGVLGAARDWDIFESTLGRGALRRAAGERGAAARRMARATARSARLRFLAEEALAWARGRPWRARSDAGRPMEEFARAALERSHARVRDVAARIDWSDAPRRHRLRIQLKSLRYACDCFRAAWPDAAMEPFLNELRRLQGILGALNDISVQRGLLAAIAGPGEARQAAALARKLNAREQVLTEDLSRAWRAFEEASPYWRAAGSVPAAG